MRTYGKLSSRLIFTAATLVALLVVPHAAATPGDNGPQGGNGSQGGGGSNKNTVTSMTFTFPVTYGSSFAFQGTVTSSSEVNEGTVTVQRGADCAEPNWGSYTPAASGVAVSGGQWGPASFQPLAAGTYAFRAKYDRVSTEFGESQTDCQGASVAKANTATTASATPTAITTGASFTLNWGVGSSVGIAGNTTTGDVSLTGADNANCLPLNASVSEAQTANGFNESGSYTCTPPMAGTYTIDVHYSGDNNYNGSATVNPVIVTVTDPATDCKAAPAIVNEHIKQTHGLTGKALKAFEATHGHRIADVADKMNDGVFGDKNANCAAYTVAVLAYWHTTTGTT